MSRVAKLRLMPGAEVRGRLAYAAYLTWERRRHASMAVRDDAALRVSLNPDVARLPGWEAQRLPRAAFLPIDSDRDRLRVTLLERYPEYVEEIEGRAQHLVSGRTRIFGLDAQVTSDYDWHRDPQTGRQWPLVYHADLPLEHTPSPFGDPKDVWELNRHQFLVDTARAWWLTGKAEYADRVSLLVQSWIRANPYCLGINWAGPLEVAYRALSWLWSYDVLRAWLPDHREFHLAWLGALVEHGRFLHRHLEVFASPYNHLIGEASVLYLLGLSLPEFTDSARWRTRGRQTLQAATAYQFYADGGSVEQATGYHHATLSFLLLAALAGRAHGDEPPDSMWRAIELATEFSLKLAQPDKRQPRLGDADDARPILGRRQDHWDFRFAQSVGAVLFNRADFKAFAGRFFEEGLWLLGTEGLDRFDALPSGRLHAGSYILPHSGYVVLRTSDDDYACFDHGEQAGGLRHDDVPSAAHGHADALAITAWLGGRQAVIDAGFFTYGRNEAWERHFRGTRAHNTVNVDGEDQAVHLAKMAWTRVPTTTLERSEVGAQSGWAAASHDGYARLSPGLRHRRTVWLTPGLLVVLDELEQPRRRAVEIVWQMPAGGHAVLEDQCVVLNDDLRIAWQTSTPAAASLTEGGPSPDSGWIAPSLGVSQPAPRLAVNAMAEGASWFALTVIADMRRWSHLAPCVVFPTTPFPVGFTLEGRDGRRVVAVLGSRDDGVCHLVSCRSNGRLTTIPPVSASRADLRAAIDWIATE